MMRVFYGSRASHAHRYQCRGDDAHVGSGLCIGIGGLRVDRAIAAAILEAVSDRAIEAAVLAPDQATPATGHVRQAASREMGAARYQAPPPARRPGAARPAKRPVAR